MKKRIYIPVILLAAGVLLNACMAASPNNTSPGDGSATISSEKEPSDPSMATSMAASMAGISGDILYSNLTDADSQKEVASVLQGQGISKEQADTLMQWADDLNERAQTPLPKGFEKMEGEEVGYNDFVFDLKETENGEYLPEANCRLTAFLLMRDFISTNGKKDESDTYLMFDMEAIDAAGQFQMSKKDRANYYSLYNWIPVSGLDTVSEHTQAIQQAWKDRDIRIDSSRNVSLICVYMHTTFEDVRIVGHTGVLFDLDGQLLFVEKYGPQAPFQATWFHDRVELKEYLLARKDLYGDEEELEPVVMENDHVMDAR